MCLDRFGRGGSTERIKERQDPADATLEHRRGALGWCPGMIILKCFGERLGGFLVTETLEGGFGAALEKCDHPPDVEPCRGGGCASPRHRGDQAPEQERDPEPDGSGPCPNSGPYPIPNPDLNLTLILTLLTLTPNPNP